MHCSIIEYEAGLQRSKLHKPSFHSLSCQKMYPLTLDDKACSLAWRSSAARASRRLNAMTSLACPRMLISKGSSNASSTANSCEYSMYKGTGSSLASFFCFAWICKPISRFQSLWMKYHFSNSIRKRLLTSKVQHSQTFAKSKPACVNQQTDICMTKTPVAWECLLFAAQVPCCCFSWYIAKIISSRITCTHLMGKW